MYEYSWASFKQLICSNKLHLFDAQTQQLTVYLIIILVTKPCAKNTGPASHGFHAYLMLNENHVIEGGYRNIAWVGRVRDGLYLRRNSVLLIQSLVMILDLLIFLEQVMLFCNNRLYSCNERIGRNDQPATISLLPTLQNTCIRGIHIGI